jgi:hypothetical protein
MTRMKLLILITSGIILALFCIFFACEQPTAKKSDDSTTTPVSSVSSSSSSASTSSASSSSSSSSGFFDDFNSYASASPWTLAGGWTGSTTYWDIVGGHTGNAVQNNNVNAGTLVSSYSGTNYTVSAKVRATVITPNTGFGLMVRRTSANVYYSVEMAYLSSASRTRIAIYKANGTDGSMAGSYYLTGQLNTSTYYTLTVSVSGSVNPLITASVTDGTESQSINWTDTGVSHGSVLTGPGNACLWTAGAASIIFDDFTVTVP